MYEVCELERDPVLTNTAYLPASLVVAATGQGPRKFRVTAPRTVVLDAIGNLPEAGFSVEFAQELATPSISRDLCSPGVGNAAAPRENVLLTFDEVVQAGLGHIQIWEAAADVAFDTIADPLYSVDVAGLAAAAEHGHGALSNNQVLITARNIYIYIYIYIYLIYIYREREITIHTYYNIYVAIMIIVMYIYIYIYIYILGPYLPHDKSDKGRRVKQQELTITYNPHLVLINAPPPYSCFFLQTTFFNIHLLSKRPDIYQILAKTLY